MDDSAIRAGKLAGLLLLAAGLSGCVVGSQTVAGRVSITNSSETTATSPDAPVNNDCPATEGDAGRLQIADFETESTKAVVPATLELEIPEIPPDIPRRAIEVPYIPEPELNREPRRLQAVVPRESVSRKPGITPRRAHSYGRVPPVPVISAAPIADEVASNEMIANDPELSEDAPGKAFVSSAAKIGNTAQIPAASEVAAEAAPADDEPGRAFVCDNADPVVVYQELPVAVPVERWPGRSASASKGAPRNNVVKRQAANPASAMEGIVRYVDPVQGIAQVVFGGATLLEPGTRLAVKHRLLYGRLASTEVVEVVSSEPGAALVRSMGAGRIAKTSIGDPAVILAR